MLSSVKFLGAGIDKTAQPIEGVDITVWANNEDFSAIGYVVDQMDSLIDEWFPGKRERESLLIYSISIIHLKVSFYDFIMYMYVNCFYMYIWYITIECVCYREFSFCSCT